MVEHDDETKRVLLAIATNIRRAQILLDNGVTDLDDIGALTQEQREAILRDPRWQETH